MRRHISPTPSRPQTRLVLGALSSLALLATIQPLLLPRQPRLPQLPADLPLPPGWRVLSSSSSSPSPALPKPPQPRAYRPLFSPLAVGTGTVLEGPAGAQVRLTPMASWAASALDPASLSPAQAGSDSSSPAAPSPATCLTARGTLQSDRDALTELPPKPEPLPRAQKALATLLPSPDRSFNCLLVSTNRPQLLKQSASSQPLWPALSRAVRWPFPPGH
ncbi:MAG: hypothetical protein ACKO02_08835 [Cyanobium sp.]